METNDKNLYIETHDNQLNSGVQELGRVADLLQLRNPRSLLASSLVGTSLVLQFRRPRTGWSHRMSH